jgi:rhomboid family GlyGly-CTERM serine protease
LAVVHNPDSASLTRKWRIGPGWRLIGLALLAMVLLWAWGDSAELALRYDRQQIEAGELWRLLTGHWVHGGFRHMALNVAGAALIAFLFSPLFVRTFSIKQWLLVLAASLIAIDLGFWFCERALLWYVGASGVLHGALLAGAITWLRDDRRTMRLLVLSVGAMRFGTALRLARRATTTLALWAILLGKLVWEQTQGALPLMGDMPVIVNAHLYGALGGGVAAAIIELLAVYSRRKASQAPL